MNEEVKEKRHFRSASAEDNGDSVMDSVLKRGNLTKKNRKFLGLGSNPVGMTQLQPSCRNSAEIYSTFVHVEMCDSLCRWLSQIELL